MPFDILSLIAKDETFAPANVSTPKSAMAPACTASIKNAIEGWIDTPQGQWFSASLFHTLDVITQSGITERLWYKYLELHPQLIDLEASLAEEWLSPELMSALRAENLRSDLTEKRSEIVRQVKAQIVGYLRSGSFNSSRLADIVNYIRLNPASFKEWHHSDTAKLFAPPVFRNEKKASGYFF